MTHVRARTQNFTRTARGECDRTGRNTVPMASLSSSPGAAPIGVIIDSPWARLRTWANARRQDDALNLILLWGIRIGLVALFVTPLIVTTGTVFPIMFS